MSRIPLLAAALFVGTLGPVAAQSVSVQTRAVNGRAETVLGVSWPDRPTCQLKLVPSPDGLVTIVPLPSVGGSVSCRLVLGHATSGDILR